MALPYPISCMLKVKVMHVTGKRWTMFYNISVVDGMFYVFSPYVDVLVSLVLVSLFAVIWRFCML